MLQLRAFGIWLLILVLAIFNGAFREALLLPNLPRPVAFVLSGLLLIGCVLAAALLLVPRLGRLSSVQYWRIGAIWLGLTLAFEFGFGYLVGGADLRQLLAAYTFKDGNIWPLVLVAVFLAPRLAGHLHDPVSKSRSPHDASQETPSRGSS